MVASIKRQRRVAELLQKEISHSLQFEIKDPRIGFVTVTEVDINPDLTTAVIFVSMLDDSQEEERAVLLGLESAAPYLKRLIGPKMKLRYMPELEFKIDRSSAYASHIAQLLDGIEIPPESDDESPLDESDMTTPTES